MGGGCAPAGEPLDVEAVRAFCDGRLSHHKIPRYLLRLFDWMMDVPELYTEDFAREASLYGVDAEISRDELEDLIESSVVVLAREEHRGLGGCA